MVLCASFAHRRKAMLSCVRSICFYLDGESKVACRSVIRQTSQVAACVRSWRSDVHCVDCVYISSCLTHFPSCCSCFGVSFVCSRGAGSAFLGMGLCDVRVAGAFRSGSGLAFMRALRGGPWGGVPTLTPIVGRLPTDGGVCVGRLPTFWRFVGRVPTFTPPVGRGPHIPPPPGCKFWCCETRVCSIVAGCRREKTACIVDVFFPRFGGRIAARAVSFGAPNGCEDSPWGVRWHAHDGRRALLTCCRGLRFCMRTQSKWL